MGLFGFDSVGDMFDGGGAGGKGDTFSTEGSVFDKDNTNDYVANGGTGAQPSNAGKVKGTRPTGLKTYTSVGTVGRVMGWANGNKKTDVAKEVDGRQVYTNDDGKQYSYNGLGLPYEVSIENGKVVDTLSIRGEDGLNGYERSIAAAKSQGDDAAVEELEKAQAANGEDDGEAYLGSETILKMAADAGLIKSNEQIQAIINDPAGFLKRHGALLQEKTPTINPNTTGTLLDGTNPNYLLGESPSVDIATADETAAAADIINPGAVTYEASTAANLLGTDENTANAATSEIREENLVDAAQIDMEGAATGRNADGTVSVVGEALNNFATQDISKIIDTSTVAGKLLAQKLGEGNYTDSKATVLGQMEIISGEFKDANNNPVVPPWAQALARDTAKTIAFSGVSGTAQTAAMSNAIMEATLGIAEKEATFFQTLTNKNLDNRQQAIINKASVLSQFEVANLNARQAAAVQNAKSFLEMDMANLTNEQQAEIVNTQAMVDALFNDQSAINAARLFSAESTNEMQKYYDNINAQVSMHNSEQINQMNRFNTGEINDGQEFNSKLEQSRQEFYASMQYSLDVANAKWRQEVTLANTEMEFEAATLDVTNTLDLTTESMTRMWDRVDSVLDYIFTGWDSESDRDAMILAAEIQAQSNQSSGGGGFLDGLFTLGAAYITAKSDKRLKENIEYFDTFNGIKFYTWDWNFEGKKVGANKFPGFGVIAQQVQLKHPKAVSVGDDGYLVVNYGEIL